MNKHDLITKIKQLDGLTQDERATLIELVNTKKKYGLVWEDKPEDVEEQLRTQLPVLREVTEKRILGKELPREIKVIETKQPDLFSSDENQVNQPNPENQGSDSFPNHILIEGDNLHALTALTFTHEGRIDVIYIDPPYNTGNKDFKYNDSFVDREDSYRHSKWLSFMDKRLRIAKRLLSEKGVIFISIDDNEQAQLRLLCDEVFGATNFISNLVWAAGKKNDSKYISNSHEYIIAYFKNIELIKNDKIVWRERKDGIDKIYKVAQSFVKKNNGNYEKATIELKKWFKELVDNDPAKAHSHYSVIDEKGVFFPDNISWPGGGGPTYEVLHPKTKRPVTVPSRGWVYSTPERMQEIIDQGKVLFGEDEKSVPTLKSYLKDREYQVPYSVIYKDGRASTKRLMDIFGTSVFTNPKDEEIIAKYIQIAGNLNSTILDFFAGSGTTLHATMQQNAEDGGSRRCILVTNNENNICEEVTYERNKRVIQGYTNSKGQWVPGLTNNNLRYYRSEFTGREPSLKNKRQLTQLATELLCIKEDCYEEKVVEGIKSIRYFSENERHFVVVYDDTAIETAVEFIKDQVASQNIQENGIKVYVFSPGQYPFTEEFEEVLPYIKLCALPDAIYKAYMNVLPKKKPGERIPELTDEQDSQETLVDE